MSEHTDPRNAQRQILALANRVMRRIKAAGFNGLTRDDVVQELWIAWCQARDSYDPSKGVPFGAYLYRGMILHINRVVKNLFERFEGFSYALSLDAPVAGDEDSKATLADALPDDTDTEAYVVAQSNYQFALTKLKPEAQAYLRLLKEAPPELCQEVLHVQEKALFGRQLGMHYARPNRLTNDMIFDLLGYNARQRSRVLAEVSALGEKLCRK